MRRGCILGVKIVGINSKSRACVLGVKTFGINSKSRAYV